jgi:hypothetical protein
MRSHLLLFALAAASAGCNTGFDPQYRVTDLRILGVRAAALPEPSPPAPSRADVRPGDRVRLSTLVANPRRRAMTVSFYGCIPSGLEAFTPCVDEELLKDPAALASTEGVTLLGRVVFPPPAAGAPKAIEAAVDLPDPVPFLPGAFDPLLQRALAQPTYQCSLFVEFPLVVVAEAEGLTAEVALKRVRVVPSAADFTRYATLHPESAGEILALQTAYKVNENPIIERVGRTPDVDALCPQALPLPATGPDTTFPMGRTLLCGVPNQGQGFNVCGANGISSQEGESRSWQWFVDAGEFPEFTGVGNAVDSAPEFERPASAFTLWVVLRDGRGGVDWGRRDVGAPPP